MITPDKIAELRKLCSEATEGPWHLDYQTPFGAGGAVCSGRNITDSLQMDEIVKQPFMTPNNKNQRWTDGRFIAAARTALPMLLDEVERLREYLRYIKRFSELHHGDQADNLLLHALKVDIPDVCEKALGDKND